MTTTTTNDKRNLWQTKTFWAGVVSILAGVVVATFGDQEAALPIKEIILNLISDEKLWLGILAITGRQALIRK